MIIDTFDPETGAFSGWGYYNANPAYTWILTGTESGADVSFHIDYTGNNPNYYVDAVGTLSNLVYMSGDAAAPGQTATWDANRIEDVIVDVGDSNAIVTVAPFADPPPENLGPSWTITVQNLPPCVMPTVRLRIPDGEDPYEPSPLCIVQFVLLGDFNGDGVVDGKDIRLIAHANRDRYYCWRYDLNGDGIITDLDIWIAEANKGQAPQWIPLPTTVEGEYLVAHPRHLSGWGIRR
jgi:hypothetical protein